MRINVAVPEPHVSAPVLDAALEATTRLNESMLRSGDLPPFNVRNPQAIWKPEPPGQEHFDHGRIVLGRGWGDCDDLAPWLAATRRAQGDRGAHAFVRKSGAKRWHALVRRGDGTVEDPSLAAGMPRRGRGHGVMGASQPFMLSGVGSYELRPQLALRPVPSRRGLIEAWQARADLPWHVQPGVSPTDVAMVSLHASPVSDQALVGALCGAIDLGEASDANPEHLDRLACIRDMLDGCDWEECAAEYGDDHADAAAAVVGSFFKRLGRKLKRGWRKVRKPLLRYAPLAAAAIPGVGPAAAAAFQMASPLLQRAIERGRYQRPARAYQPPPPPPSYSPPPAYPSSFIWSPGGW